MKAAKKTTEKLTPLAREVEKLFSAQEGTLEIAPPPAYIGEQRVVESVTTYSACEDPIPNLYKRQ